jgi:hypothetical protein
MWTVCIHADGVDLLHSSSEPLLVLTIVENVLCGNNHSFSEIGRSEYLQADPRGF